MFVVVVVVVVAVLVILLVLVAAALMWLFLLTSVNCVITAAVAVVLCSFGPHLAPCDWTSSDRRAGQSLCKALSALQAVESQTIAASGDQGTLKPMC